MFLCDHGIIARICKSITSSDITLDARSALAVAALPTKLDVSTFDFSTKACAYLVSVQPSNFCAANVETVVIGVGEPVNMVNEHIEAGANGCPVPTA
jgi:hypothetical protein